MKLATKFLTLVILFTLSTLTVRAARPADGEFPSVKLNGPARSANAIHALGEHLPAVAKAYGLTADELKLRFMQDKSLSVDQDGRLFFVCDSRPPAGAAVADGATPSASVAPLADTFKLHSRAGSKRIIYLDFNGHVLTGGAWNSYTGVATINCPAWDIDGNSSAFGTNELTRIQEVWQRVAEDYAAFDVDVTTELTDEALITRSNSSDEYYGTRVLISAISSYFGQYGGIAYVGIYNMVGDYYKPALVFPEWLGNNAKNIAEAASHECGHNCGLSHDGTPSQGYYAGHGSGETGWAPIMGVGYYQNLSQWSKGEYPNANNTEDDLAIIQSYGLAYRVDDHGDTTAAATILLAGTQLSASGNIERNTDLDVFRFNSGTGTATISIGVNSVGPDLDVLAELLDANGAVIASNNSADLLAASFSQSLTAGIYYLRIRGTGKGDLTTGYSNYGSLGQYTVTGTVANPNGTVPPIAVANASPKTGDAPLTVSFNSTGSTDPDGSIVSYSWTFGDGGSALGASVQHAYGNVGNYTATLVVTDNTSLTGSSNVTINVTAPNIVPVAVAGATPTTGYAPLAVNFNSTGSFDPDGNISSYAWNFGDGTTGSGATVSHTYSTVGSFTAVLTVTDNRGATATSSVGITTSQSPTIAFRVASIQVTVANVNGGKRGTAKVKITDLNNNAISGATVTGQWSGVVTGTSSGTTDTTGTATHTSSRFKRSGTLTYQVTGVSKTGYTYDASKNVVTQVSVSAAGTP